MMSKNIICFDLEGPLSPQDNAYEVMGLIDNGYKIFEVISRYDDILTLENRAGYEPGDTLSLIIPFLLYHGVTEEDIRRVSDKAKIVDGVAYVITWLKNLGWETYIISTSYSQHAYNIGGRIGVPQEKIYCTTLHLDAFRKMITSKEKDMIDELEKDILNKLCSSMDNEKKLKNRLDSFYYKEIKKTVLGELMSKVKVIGGQRKVNALEKIASENNKSLRDIIVVGDSITDYKMLDRVKSEGGLSVAFNANKYAIPYASVGLASTDMRFLIVLIEGYMRGGVSKALEVARCWEINHKKFMDEPESIPDNLIPSEVKTLLEAKVREENFFRPRFHLLTEKNKEQLDEVIKIHAESRALVRGAAAKLG